MSEGGLDVSSESAASPAAAALIAALSAELAARYDLVDDGSGHFKPADVDVARSVFLVGRLGGRPVACGAIRPLDEDAAEVKRMYVLPSARGCGHAGRILAALEEAARGFGYRTLRLETGDRQPEAVRLYEACGYRRIGPFPPYVGSARSLCFEKSLR